MEFPHGSVDLGQVNQDPAGPGLQLDCQQHLVCGLLQLTLLAKMPRGDKQVLHLQAFRAIGCLERLDGALACTPASACPHTPPACPLVKMPRLNK